MGFSMIVVDDLPLPLILFEGDSNPPRDGALEAQPFSFYHRVHSNSDGGWIPSGGEIDGMESFDTDCFEMNRGQFGFEVENHL